MSKEQITENEEYRYSIREEKPFVFHAFPDTLVYYCAKENGIPVRPLYAIVTD